MSESLGVPLDRRYFRPRFVKKMNGWDAWAIDGPLGGKRGHFCGSEGEAVNKAKFYEKLFSEGMKEQRRIDRQK